MQIDIPSPKVQVSARSMKETFSEHHYPVILSADPFHSILHAYIHSSNSTCRLTKEASECVSNSTCRLTDV